MENYIKPLKLSSTRVWRTYLGGKLIDKMYNKESLENSSYPEEWICSCTEARSTKVEKKINEGLSKLEDKNIFLKDLIEKDPEQMLGVVHYKKYKNSLGVLAKIIDSSERLTIQCHPSKMDAKKYFNSEFGKTEAWYILNDDNSSEKAKIYVGFKENITKENFKEMFINQDLEGMLNSLHEIEVNFGDVFLIEGGVPHAIGKGCFLVEIQEPTDYTLRVEKTTPSGLVIEDSMCHQGIGFENMFELFKFDGYSKQEVLEKWKIPTKLVTKNQNYTEYDLIKNSDTKCFSMKKIELTGEYTLSKKETFYLLKIIKGGGFLEYSNERKEIKVGGEFFIPANLEGIKIIGKLEGILFMPPVS